MKKMTEGNLRAAFAGESQAHMRYLIFGDRAEREGRSNVARLFRAIAYAEQVHAANHYKELGEIKGTSENLGVAIEGETFEVEEMYPSYIAVAELQEEKGAKRSTEWAWESEKTHAEIYRKAQEAVNREEDLNLGNVHICEVCGFLVSGEPPERCPVCNARSDRFRGF